MLMALLHVRYNHIVVVYQYNRTNWLLRVNLLTPNKDILSLASIILNSNLSYSEILHKRREFDSWLWNLLRFWALILFTFRAKVKGILFNSPHQSTSSRVNKDNTVHAYGTTTIIIMLFFSAPFRALMRRNNLYRRRNWITTVRTVRLMTDLGGCFMSHVSALLSDHFLLLLPWYCLFTGN